ncbi:MAG TPA: ATP-binding protein [Ktedonobacteraceae bacterium]|nr:ATP-binding protein [Ktedonobacteraceae bacterium]
MYIPLQLRLTLFYALLLGLALWFFGNVVYSQAEQRAYHDLDTELSSRTASVIVGKELISNQNLSNLPLYLNNSINGLGAGDIAIEVLDTRLRLLATTTYSVSDILQPGVTGSNISPVPWDKQAASRIASHPYDSNSNPNGIYSTITYQGQPVRVYTTINQQSGDIVQTARSELSIQQSLSSLRQVLWQGGALVLVLALAGGWFMTWSVLATVRRMTKTARRISASQDFGQRVAEKTIMGKNELTRLATTFNDMLAELEAAYQQQQRFVADASHELRAPITSIRCNLDLLAKAPDLAPGEASAALSDARVEADRMGRLVNDLLTLARADSMAPEPASSGYMKSVTLEQKIDLDSLLLEVYRQYRTIDEFDPSSLQAKGPRIILQDITPARVYGDADKLKQTLVALLENAVKYTPYEGSVTLALTTNDGNAQISVSDSGIGILPEDLPHIFERFYRADPARSRDRGGSGLGLAIVKSIVEEHQGSIDVESTPGKGSTFRVKLPLICE